jgi:hypothetical protein
VIDVNDLTEVSIRIVLAVARLGEADQAGWWRSHGLSNTGRYVLSSNFPRTWEPAALELDVAAASYRHSQLLERETALHLFSDHLPFRRFALAWLAETKTQEEPVELLRALSDSDEAAVRALVEGEASTPASGEVIGNGLLLGRLEPGEVEDEDVLLSVVRRLAGGYVDQQSKLLPPYFDLSR